MPESSRQHKCRRRSSQEGNKANPFPFAGVSNVSSSSPFFHRTIMGFGSKRRRGGLSRGGGGVGGAGWFQLLHPNARKCTLGYTCSALHSELTVPNLKCIKSKVRNQNHWGFFFFLEGRAPPFFTPTILYIHMQMLHPHGAHFFFSPLPHCSHKYRAVKMQSSWSKLISDTLSGMYYHLRCSPVLDAAAPPKKKKVRTRRVCVFVCWGGILPPTWLSSSPDYCASALPACV